MQRVHKTPNGYRGSGHGLLSATPLGPLRLEVVAGVVMVTALVMLAIGLVWLVQAPPAQVEFDGGSTTPAPAGILIPFLMSLLAGLSTGLGGLVVLCMGRSPTPAAMAFILALAGGVMISCSVLEFFLPAITGEGASLVTVGMWSALGAGCFFGLSRLLPEAEADDMLPGTATMKTDGATKRRKWRLALVMMVVLTLHNFPEGLAVAVSAMQSPHLGVVVMVAIAIHNIPEGIAIAVPLYASTGNKGQALLMTLLSGFSEPLGAMVALVFLRHSISEQILENVLCFVAGIMTTVAVWELFPEAHRQGEPLAMVAGGVVGFLVMHVTVAYV
mmetsp:Transcript_30961/g.69667  ORF Transcript_30961/g.69667 Transcript_30961/m.69667 type:complete len:330 (+) Transcript_30961:15-1004(+)